LSYRLGKHIIGCRRNFITKKFYYNKSGVTMITLLISCSTVLSFQFLQIFRSKNWEMWHSKKIIMENAAFLVIIYYLLCKFILSASYKEKRKDIYILNFFFFQIVWKYMVGFYIELRFYLICHLYNSDIHNIKVRLLSQK
jgi:hypothetical protein